MITSRDLAQLTIRRIIFHDVPSHLRSESSKPTLADTVTQIDQRRSHILKKRLTQVLGSRSAYPVQFLAQTSSPVPAEVTRYTSRAHSLSHFVQISRRMAQFLFDQQGGAMSPGLLCVIDVASAGRSAIAILKLERETGAELQWRRVRGKQAIEMSVLDNLVLTDGTRLFKSVMFIRTGRDTFRSAACDSQRTIVSSADVARFWLRFLGCGVTEEPRVATQRWFDTTIRFVNEYVTDPVAKNELYEHLVSELNSNKPVVAPRRFVEDYVSEDFRRPYIEFLKQNQVALHQFDKDTSDIASKLKRRSFHTTKGVTVTAPADQQDLIGIEPEQIIVHDQLQSVANK
jgi:hypothetical protein